MIASGVLVKEKTIAILTFFREGDSFLEKTYL